MQMRGISFYQSRPMDHAPWKLGHFRLAVHANHASVNYIWVSEQHVLQNAWRDYKTQSVGHTTKEE